MAALGGGGGSAHSMPRCPPARPGLCARMQKEARACRLESRLRSSGGCGQTRVRACVRLWTGSKLRTIKSNRQWALGDSAFHRCAPTTHLPPAASARQLAGLASRRIVSFNANTMLKFAGQLALPY